ncbi:hypothetical protein AVEN_256593-1 [Araneus ventricosus]|uniref:Uncharacterized protein n=1 Tax=Araneus ventricosus TaxID=182803 RepID=A0A4Y2LL54_ARAVE|nr:hypothetical protein AVEN_256593-1 [Araneus ventricosus]
MKIQAFKIISGGKHLCSPNGRAATDGHITGLGTDPSRRRCDPSTEMWPSQSHVHCYTPPRRSKNPPTYPSTSHPRTRAPLSTEESLEYKQLQIIRNDEQRTRSLVGSFRRRTYFKTFQTEHHNALSKEANKIALLIS